ncbi:MAG TPA: SCP2 sterol-binding domain-containing protein [Candidatus Lokiarchaeia archaeon]|nr:SCP2 sterol-binding domain-containing protein [Candidatus Lokiarchaeia archaeon]
MDFQTQEWADEYARCLNDNPNYEKSAKTWEGPLVLEFTAESIKLETTVRLWLDLWHGKCREARFLQDDEEALIEYTISAPESMWAALVKDELDPTKALMSGKFKIKGNMSKLMRFPLAAGYLIKYLKRMLPEW